MAGVLRNGGASIWILEWQSFQCVRVRFFESGRADEAILRAVSGNFQDFLIKMIF